MGKFQDINAIYKILGLYEDISDADSPVDLTCLWVASPPSIYNPFIGLYILLTPLPNHCIYNLSK